MPKSTSRYCVPDIKLADGDSVSIDIAIAPIQGDTAVAILDHFWPIAEGKPSTTVLEDEQLVTGPDAFTYTYTADGPGLHILMFFVRNRSRRGPLPIPVPETVKILVVP